MVIFLNLSIGVVEGAIIGYAHAQTLNTTVINNNYEVEGRRSKKKKRKKKRREEKRKKAAKLANQNTIKQIAANGGKLVIGYHHPRAGFFSCFLGVVNNLIWCDKKNVTPVVYWGDDCLYYETEGYNGSKNVWEYYFEPVSQATYDGEPIRKEYEAPDMQFVNLISDHCKMASNKQFRAEINRIIRKYIKIKPNIQQKIDAFYASSMHGKITIGIHVRGTDKSREIKNVDRSLIFKQANKIAENYKDYQFLVATDEQAILEQAQRELKGPVIYYDAYRSLDNNPIHLDRYGVSKGKLGEDVLIEVQLLSRCNFLVNTCSNVSACVLMFNPQLDNLLLDELYLPMEQSTIQNSPGQASLGQDSPEQASLGQDSPDQYSPSQASLGQDSPGQDSPGVTEALNKSTEASTKMVINACPGSHGLFSCFITVLNQLAWCDKNNVIPVVYWDKDCSYYDPKGFNGKQSIWEYYFEPVSCAQYDGIEPINNLHLAATANTYAPEINHFNKNTREKWLRKAASTIIKKYIKMQPVVQAKIDEFYQKNMQGKKTIGIHIRGTDKKSETPTINPSVIFEAANTLSLQYPGCQFLVATDELSILEQAKRELKGPIIYYEARRSNNGKPLHLDATVSNAQNGEDVVIEVQLLARCDHFLHTLSNVSTAVILFNPELAEELFVSCKAATNPSRICD